MGHYIAVGTIVGGGIDTSGMSGRYRGTEEYRDE